MKQSGASSSDKSPDTANFLDDDQLIARTILGISTLQLEMMNKLVKLEDNQNLILEETRLERAKHQAIIEFMERHYDKEMDRFMEMVNLIVEAMKRREQLVSQQQAAEASRASAQSTPFRNVVQPTQTFNAAATPSSFLCTSGAVQHGLQNFPLGMNQQMQLNYILQAQQAQQIAQQQQLAQMEAQRQLAQAMAAASQNGQMNLAALRAMQPTGIEASQLVPAVTTTSAFDVKAHIPAAATSVPAKPAAKEGLPTPVKLLGTSLFGASTGASPFIGSAFGFGTTALGAKAQTEDASALVKTQTESTATASITTTADKKIAPFGGLTFASPEKSVFSLGGQKETVKNASFEQREEDVEDFVPNAEFKPVIPLPPLVESKTGEEDETVLFKARAKLYRFVRELNEYKERGIGDIKILQNKDGKSRIVMRRDQVLKVCANTPIRVGMKINKKPGNDTACIFACKDYSEEPGGTNECFVVRLKTSQLADEFVKVFNDALKHLADSEMSQAKNELRDGNASTCSQLRDLLKDTVSPTSTFTDVKVETKTEVEKKVSEKKVEQGFGDAFKPAPGSWECKSCYTRNAADKNVCPCCGTKKDGSVAESTFRSTTFMSKPIVTTTAPKEGAFSFGITTGVPFPKSTAAPPVVTTNQVSPTTSISFGFGFSSTSSKSATSTATPQPTTQSSSSSTSGAGLPTFSFSPLPASKVTSKTVSPASFSFSTTTVPSAVKPEATTAAPATTKPSFSFAKPTLPVSTTMSSAAPKTTFSTPFGFMSSPQEASKGPVSFSFKTGSTSDTKPVSSGPTFGGSPVFGAKPSTSVPATATTAKSTSKEGSPASAKSFGNSLFGASAASSPFSGSVFGGGTSGGFAALAAKAQTESPTTSEKTTTDKKITPFGGGAFGSKEKSVFSIEATKETTKKDAGSEQREEDAEEFVPNVEFKPIIPLPPLVESKTGEEDETVLFKARCKLYRFVRAASEYRERGVGDIKILRNNEGKCRVVMRREQVLKVCVNAPIRSGMKISEKPGTDNACMWACKDYSEDEKGSNECLVARFKTTELAKDFMSKFEAAINACAAPRVSAPAAPPGPSVPSAAKITPTAAVAVPSVSPFEDRRPIAERLNAPSSSSKDVVELIRSNEKGDTDEEDYDEEDDEYEGLKDYAATVHVTDAYQSPMKPGTKLEVKGLFAIGIRHAVNAMEIDVLDSAGVSELSHTVSKDDKFTSTSSNTLEYITIDDRGKNVRVFVNFDRARDKDEALSHLQKGVSMAAENED